MAARAELRPAKRLRSRADRVHAVAFNTIEPRRVRASRNVTAALEELERLRVTLAAHLKSRGGIGPGDEVSGVCFSFLRFRGISAVTAVASDAHLSVRARLIKAHDLIAAVAGDASVGHWRRSLRSSSENPGRNNAKP